MDAPSLNMLYCCARVVLKAEANCFQDLGKITNDGMSYRSERGQW